MRPRFREFAFSLRPYDQGWINYQQGIALRHISAKKNRVDVHLLRRSCGTVKQLRLNVAGTVVLTAKPENCRCSAITVAKSLDRVLDNTRDR